MKKTLAGLASLITFLVVCLFTARAHAERVVVIDDPDMHRFATRLRGELVAIGFEVIVRTREEAASQEELEALARAEGAVAALHVRAKRSPSRHGTEVWVMDRITSKMVLREIVPSTTGDDVAEVALAAVELLRASLLEVENPKFVPKVAEQTPVAAKLVIAGREGSSSQSPPSSPAPLPPRLAIVLGPAGALSPGGLGATPHVDVWARFDAHARLALHARLVLPTIPAVVGAEEGRATVTFSIATVGADFLLSHPDASIRPRMGIGVGAVWAHMEGTASQSFVGRGDNVFATFSFAHGGVALRFAREARLLADVSIGLAAPRPVVSFAGRSAAAWGEPVALATLGLELPISF